MKYVEYLGFVGVPYKVKGGYYIDVCDMASQVLTAGGSNLDELKLNVYLEVDNFYESIKRA